MAKKSLSDLPEGMITEILLRLPINSLGQCKSVCKPWLSTISNPHFVRSHIQHAITASQNDPTLLNVINVSVLALLFRLPSMTPNQPELERHELQRRRRQLFNQALDDADGQDLSRSRLHLDHVAIPSAFGVAHFVSCSNGIICLSSSKAVYLWNPSINKFRKVPLKYINLWEPDLEYIPVTIGFGYDNISNEYKLLRFWYKNRGDVVPVVRVYYVDDDFCCRELEGPILTTRIKRRPSNIVVNGVLYFNAGDQLVSFDLHDEVFVQVPFPDSILRKMSDIMDFEGSVAMVFESGQGVHLWMLNNVSGELSWTKKFSIEYGLNDLDTDIWLSCYLGAKQFYGRKLVNRNYFVYEILYDYEKKETKYYGLREEYINVYVTAEEWEIPVRSILGDSVEYEPCHVALKYTQTLVSLDKFEPVENAIDDEL